MAVKDVHKICPVCNSEKILKRKRYYSGKGLLKCRTCGLYFMERIPSREELLEHYSDYPYVFPQKIRNSIEKNYNEILDMLEPFRKNNRLLEFGCGTGFFLTKAMERGWDVHGIELSEKAIRECKENKISVFRSINELPITSEEKYDVAVSIEVIEHLSDFSGTMEQISGIIRNGGGFYCTTPNFNNITRYIQKENYYNIEYPEHLLYFSCRSLRTAMKKYGFSQRKINTTGIDISAGRINFTLNNPGPVSLTSNEKYLARSDKSYIFGFLKKSINLLLSFFRIGMTTKALYIKSN